jgi:acyl carrier protein
MRITREQIERDVHDIIRRMRPDLGDGLRGEDRLRDDLGLDSLHSMELLSEVTERYRIDVDPQELEDVRTVAEVVGFLARLNGLPT